MIIPCRLPWAVTLSIWWILWVKIRSVWWSEIQQTDTGRCLSFAALGFCLYFSALLVVSIFLDLWVSSTLSVYPAVPNPDRARGRYRKEAIFTFIQSLKLVIRLERTVISKPFLTLTG